MKIAFALPHEVDDSWHLFPQEPTYPQEITSRLSTLLELEDLLDVEYKIVSTHPTVLNCVQVDGLISYEDVYLVENDQLVPLLEKHSQEWLAQNKLGTSAEKGLL